MCICNECTASPCVIETTEDGHMLRMWFARESQTRSYSNVKSIYYWSEEIFQINWLVDTFLRIRYYPSDLNNSVADCVCERAATVNRNTANRVRFHLRLKFSASLSLTHSFSLPFAVSYTLLWFMSMRSWFKCQWIQCMNSQSTIYDCVSIHSNNE